VRRSLRNRLANALDRRFEPLHHRIEGVARDVAGMRGEVARLSDEVAGLARRLDHDLLPALRLMAGRDAENRRQLADARADPEYELAYSDPDPLVTIVLPTFRRAGLLRERSLPAVLAQTHERLEVLVVGDGPDGEAETVVDDRLPLKGALVHSHLRFFERDHVASAFGIAGDWFRGERMLRAGVRIELLDRITYEYYPSSLWQQEP
jgi:hypothetical protein